jgi:hypothetical protein
MKDVGSFPARAGYTGAKGASRETEPKISSATSCCSGYCLSETCNLQELAARPGMPSLRRLRLMIREHRDFPVISMGRNGAHYVLPVLDAEAFVRSRLNQGDGTCPRRSF